MDSRTVGILGAGQLGRMMVEAAHRLNIRTVLLDVAPDAPAKQLNATHPHVSGSFADPDSVRKLARECDIITAEIEHIDTHVLEELSFSGQVEVQPDFRTIRTIQDKYLQKRTLLEGGVATADVIEVGANTRDALESVGSVFGYPYMLKSRTGAYDGRGNYAVQSQDDIDGALEALKGRPLYAERWAEFEMELAVMVARTGNGDVRGYPVAETVHEDSVLRVTYVPARQVPTETLQRARALAEKAVGLFAGKGVFGVEMFLMKDGSILINEIAPRPHNSGHYTIEACPTSQFEIHLRSILDLPLPPSATQLATPSTNAIMVNILGHPTDPKGHLQMARDALSVPGATVHLYGKGDGRSGRKMGHITIIGESMDVVEKNAASLIAQACSKPPSPVKPVSASPDGRKPTVAIIMGSDSDLPTLVPGCKILRDFGVPFLCTVVSAHRTPARMVEFAHSARDKGFKCIIAAAGGAAHLPGMVASETTLPVIGVPVKATHLGGVDSVLSILQMPRGIPVATVGVGNGTNAALLAIRLLAVEDLQLRDKLDKYIKKMEEEVLRKAEKMETGVDGWDGYGA